MQKCSINISFMQKAVWKYVIHTSGGHCSGNLARGGKNQRPRQQWQKGARIARWEMRLSQIFALLLLEPKQSYLHVQHIEKPVERIHIHEILDQGKSLVWNAIFFYPNFDLNSPLKNLQELAFTHTWCFFFDKARFIYVILFPWVSPLVVNMLSVEVKTTSYSSG